MHDASQMRARGGMHVQEPAAVAADCEFVRSPARTSGASPRRCRERAGASTRRGARTGGPDRRPRPPCGPRHRRSADRSRLVLTGGGHRDRPRRCPRTGNPAHRGRAGESRNAIHGGVGCLCPGRAKFLQKPGERSPLVRNRKQRQRYALEVARTLRQTLQSPDVHEKNYELDECWRTDGQGLALRIQRSARRPSD